MGAAGSVREDSLPDRTSRSVRTKFSFNPPLDGFSSNAEVVSKAITDRNKVVAVDNASKVKTTTKDICHSQVEVDYVTDVEKFSKDVFERSHIIDGQHIIHLSESGRLSFMSFLKKE